MCAFSPYPVPYRCLYSRNIDSLYRSSRPNCIGSIDAPRIGNIVSSPRFSPREV
ncbi:MAG: FAD-dependent oxidoreductase [Tannerella sp.]|nr:FAD-dependent oxidoreductase [Tannerella sp.]